ncbi:MAG: MtaA/CmuA family methyltransferase [bacterium]|nr:MtaA/CmuA family methyltransferase [bacterium]
MTPKKRVLSAILGSKRLDRVPIVCVNQTITKEQLKELNISLLDAHTSPEKMAKLAFSAIEMLGFDNVRVPFCQTVEAEALGCKIRFSYDSLPTVETHPFKIDSLPTLPSDILSKGRIPIVISAVEKLSREIGKEYPVIAGIVGPFSLAGYLLGLNEILVASISETQSLKRFLDITLELGIIYGKALINAGADIICVEDMSASTEMISPKIYKDLILPYHKRLFEELKSAVTVLHICGNVTPIIQYMADSGADALSIDHKLDLSTATQVKDKVSLIGNLDPVRLLLQGTANEIVKAGNKALESGIDLLAPGCSLALETSIENIKALQMISLSKPSYTIPNKRKSNFQIFVRYDLSKGEEKVKERLVKDVLEEVREAVINGNTQKVIDAIKKALETYDPIEIINKGLVEGINVVSELWNKGEYFLPQVILSADAMQIGIKMCEEYMGKPIEKKGKIVMHVAEGDIHTIGKDIVKALLVAHGYEVIDLGVDVPIERVVEAVKKYKPCLLTGSALMTTTMSAFPRIAKRLEEEGINIPFACGGGAVNQEFCESFKFGIYGGKAINAPLIAEAARSGKSWQEIREMFHK